jgi:hypothetical protein
LGTGPVLSPHGGQRSFFKNYRGKDEEREKERERERAEKTKNFQKEKKRKIEKKK